MPWPRALALVAVVLLVTVAAALAWQHARYQRLRREVVQDRQAAWYPAQAFHVVTYLQAPPGADVLAEVGALRRAVEADGQAQMVYAGRAAFTAIESAQVAPAAWDAVVVVQYPSRAAYDAARTAPAQRAALARFARTYAHGFTRDRLTNLGIPPLLLGLRVRDLALGRPPRYPFTPLDAAELAARPGAAERAGRVEQLHGLKAYDADAVVIVNLLRHGTPEQQAADQAYGFAMAGLFAEQAHGPMHMGRAVTLEGEAQFDRVAIVYYPGVDYFIAMARSTFFNGIVGDKQPGDTLAVPTVPILDQLVAGVAGAASAAPSSDAARQ